MTLFISHLMSTCAYRFFVWHKPSRWCHMQVWANNANNDKRRIHLCFSEHLERCQLECCRIPKFQIPRIMKCHSHWREGRHASWLEKFFLFFFNVTKQSSSDQAATTAASILFSSAAVRLAVASCTSQWSRLESESWDWSKRFRLEVGETDERGFRIEKCQLQRRVNLPRPLIWTWLVLPLCFCWPAVVAGIRKNFSLESWLLWQQPHHNMAQLDSFSQPCGSLFHLRLKVWCQRNLGSNELKGFMARNRSVWSGLASVDWCVWTLRGLKETFVASFVYWCFF